MTTLMEPHASEAAAPFWDATRERRLVLPWCTACDKAFWVPREVCPTCWGDTVEWRPASGEGVVYAVSVHHRPGPGRAAEDGPYAVALIELAEGPRMMSNVVGCPPEAATVGTAVTLSWHELSDGRHLPQFSPAGTA